MKAKYISVWDNNIKISSDCEFDINLKIASEIESLSVEGLTILIEEFVELSTGEVIKTFTGEDGRKIVNGQLEE